jgi:diguanylate cyclase (GGDEF)-like protein
MLNVFQAPSGDVFFETMSGLYLRKSGETALNKVKAVDALLGASNRIQDGCRSPNGDIWFLANNSRLVRLKEGVWTEPPIDGLPTNMRGSFLAFSCSQNGAIWVTGDQTGTWRLTPSGQRMQAWELKLPSELRTLAPLAIVADHRGWVWLGTDVGLAVWNGQSWRHLTQESGLIWNDVNQGIMREAPDGSLWIGTSGGLSHLIHPEQVFTSIPMRITLTEFRRGDKNYLGAPKITIPWEGPPLLFRISSPTVHNLSDLVLLIRMVGYQSEWMQTQTGNATFSRLPPGKFKFMAKACNPDLDACSETIQVDVLVLPPWWRTYWFYGLCGLASLLLLIAVVQLYVRGLRARSQHLEVLVAERTGELEASREQLRIQATHDGLTGMLNRTAVLKTFVAELDRARRERRTVVVALIDLDFFKHVNDTYGHLAGDEALRLFSAAVGAAIRPYDHAGRYGGEEFLLILTEIPREIVEQRLSGLHAAISNLKVSLKDVKFTLNCSMGATVYDPTEHAGNVESLLAIADRALYAAKAEGRNRVVFYAPGVVGSQPRGSAAIISHS